MLAARALVAAAILHAGSDAFMIPTLPVSRERAGKALSVGISMGGARLRSASCTGTPTAEWTIPEMPTSADAADTTCQSTYVGSYRGEWCEFSDADHPRLHGTYFADAADCSTDGEEYGWGGGDAADGSCVGGGSYGGTSARLHCGIDHQSAHR